MRNAPYKKHLGKIGDFDGGPYKTHFQNCQFDVSLLENFQKKVHHHFFKNFRKIFQNSLFTPFWKEIDGGPYKKHFQKFWPKSVSYRPLLNVLFLDHFLTKMSNPRT